MAQFDGSEGEFISLAEAAQFTENYRNSEQYELNAKRKALFFGREKLLEILNQENCMGLRMYYAIRPAESPEDDGAGSVLVIVGADADGNNQTGGNLLEHPLPCPKNCPEDEEDPPLGGTDG